MSSGKTWISPDNNVILRNVHDENVRCMILGCVIHNPTKDSVMNIEKWDYWWDGIMYRVCPHALIHPDVDSANFHSRNGDEDILTHVCDKCCERQS